jgi:hypothetical protein
MILLSDPSIYTATRSIADFHAFDLETGKGWTRVLAGGTKPGPIQECCVLELSHTESGPGSEPHSVLVFGGHIQTDMEAMKKAGACYSSSLHRYDVAMKLWIHLDILPGGQVSTHFPLNLGEPENILRPR